MQYKPLVVATLMSLLAAPAIAQDSNACFNPARMSTIAKESGLNWEQRNAELWRVDLESRTRRFVRVVTSCGKNVVYVFAVLADAKDLKQSEDLYLYLLRMVSKYDHVKIAIDPDGDYLVRIDLRTRTFDAKDLEAAAIQVRNVVDNIMPTLSEHAAK